MPTFIEAKLSDEQEAEIESFSRSWAERVTEIYAEKACFTDILDNILTAANLANAYIDEKAPWKLKKEDPAMMEHVLYVLAEAVRCIAIQLQPFCPDAAAKLLDQLAVPEHERTFAHLTAEYALKSGTPLPAPQGVFPRIQPKEEAA